MLEDVAVVVSAGCFVDLVDLLTAGSGGSRPGSARPTPFDFPLPLLNCGANRRLSHTRNFDRQPFAGFLFSLSLSLYPSQFSILTFAALFALQLFIAGTTPVPIVQLLSCLPRLEVSQLLRFMCVHIRRRRRRSIGSYVG